MSSFVFTGIVTFQVNAILQDCSYRGYSFTQLTNFLILDDTDPDTDPIRASHIHSAFSIDAHLVHARHLSSEVEDFALFAGA